MGQSVLAADKKPLTKEESAKVIEAAIRYELKNPTGELTKADYEKVTQLGLHRSHLTEIPKELEKLNQLKTLWLSDNQLTDVTGLEKLDQLKKLYLQNNQLTELPKGLEKLDQLTYLHLSDNQLADVTGLEKLNQLKTLWLSDNQLTEVPKGLEKLTQLEGLLLDANNLTSVKDLEKLTKLKELYLENNPALTKAQIAELKEALPKCKIESNPTK